MPDAKCAFGIGGGTDVYRSPLSLNCRLRKNSKTTALTILRQSPKAPGAVKSNPLLLASRPGRG